ncbi:MAG: PDZ domain-containing protein, partial [Candidatus Eremiobacterota bacterium]
MKKLIPILLLFLFSFTPSMASLEKGETAPDFNTAEQNGKEITLEDYNQNNLFIYFIKYLDEPGKREIMSMNKLKSDFPGAFLNIIIITADEECYNTLSSYTKEQNINFPVILDKDKVIHGIYNIERQFPVLYLIGKNRKIISSRTGFLQPLDKFFTMSMKEIGQDLSYTPAKSGRPWLGMLIIQMPDYLKEFYGVTKGLHVGKVIPASPAQGAGFQTGDVIIKFDGTEVEEEGQIKDILENKHIGDEVNIVFVRRKPVPVIFSIKKEPSMGWDIDNIPDIMKPIYSAEKGLIIKDIKENSASEKAGMKKFDLILSANKKEIETEEDLQQVTDMGGDTINLQVIRLVTES